MDEGPTLHVTLDAGWTRSPELVTQRAQMGPLFDALLAAPLVALDIETTGLNPRADTVRLIALATEERCWVVDTAAVDPHPLIPVLAAVPLVGHHLAFDLGFLVRRDLEPGTVRDTLLMARLLSAGLPEAEERGYHTLAALAERELGARLPKELQRSDWTGALTEAQIAYAARDAAVLLPLHARLAARIREAGLERAAEIEHRCLPAVVALADAGVPFDAAAWKALADEAEAEARRLRDALDADAPPLPGVLPLGAGGNWDSPTQVLDALRAAGCPVADTADETLAACDHPLASLLRRYRAARRRADGFGHGWLSHVTEGRLYPEWRQMGSVAGRMACRRPNVQQVPRDPRYRACIAPPPGYALVKADYSQIELRIAARIAGETRMQAAYERGEDLHALTARHVLGTESVSREARQLAKAVNFGLLYGMGAEGFRRYARACYGLALTPEEAAGYRAAFFRAYPRLAAWHRRVRAEGAAEGRTLAGRRRRFPAGTPDTERLNTPVQGTGADGLKLALALLWERRDACWSAIPVLACHDEIVVQCPAAEAEAAAAWLRQAMEDAMAPLLAPIPVAVEVGWATTWAG